MLGINHMMMTTKKLKIATKNVYLGLQNKKDLVARTIEENKTETLGLAFMFD